MPHGLDTRITDPHVAENVKIQPTEDDAQFLQQTARLCDGKFSAAPEEYADQPCAQPSAHNTPAEHVWSAKHSGAHPCFAQLPSRPAGHACSTDTRTHSVSALRIGHQPTVVSS